jgi:hypothetical protein
MNEAEWLACADPQPMLLSLRGQASERKLRLLCIACCRRVWHLLESERLKGAVGVLERSAEQTVEVESLRAAASDAHPLRSYPDEYLSSNLRSALLVPAYGVQIALLKCPDIQAMGQALAYFAVAVRAARDERTQVDNRLTPCEAELNAQGALLRDIFGPLAFRPLPRLNAAWLAWESGTVPKLAAAIYDERAFDRLPVLADALEEAGCDAAELLAHLRGPEAHVRGCWAVDLLLGKG